MSRNYKRVMVCLNCRKYVEVDTSSFYGQLETETFKNIHHKHTPTIIPLRELESRHYKDFKEASRFKRFKNGL